MIEQAFAAAVFNARHEATIARINGFWQTTADQIAGALADLWACGRALGYTTAQINEIVDRHVEYDDAGEPQPRAREDNTVVTMRRR